MKVIYCNRLNIQIASKLILSGLDFTIEGPQFVGVFGPNGAGKTSFMKTVLGILSVRQGTLQVLGQFPRQARRKIGYVPQYREIDSFHLTGRAFIASSVRGNHLGLPFLTRNDNQEIDRVLEYVDAVRLAALPLAEMSGGQKQRIMLAQALLGNPELIILDEPFGNLDPKWVKLMLSLIRTIQQERKLTVLLSTHDLNPLLHVVDQVLCIGNQKAVLGRVDDVVTSEALTRLYGFPIQVVEAGYNRFVTTVFT